MKSIGVTLQRIYLTKNCKNNHCAISRSKTNPLKMNSCECGHVLRDIGTSLVHERRTSQML